jgi:hypothetical protein
MASYDSSTLSEITGTDSHIAATTTPTKTTSTQPRTMSSLRAPLSGFLSLAPVQAQAYNASSSSPATDKAAPAPEVTPIPKERRSSSVSSEGLSKRRVLKLSPVRDGEGGSDFVELDEE